jgi:DNA transformation protein
MASGFVAYLLDLLVGEATAGLGRASARAMFGGHGLYLGDLMVGLIADDVLYLKTDAQTRAEFEAAGARPFEFQMRTRAEPVVLSYFEAPADALDDTEAMRHWLELAHGAAKRAAARRARPKPRSRTRGR